MVLILDNSGSMQDKDTNGRNKLAAAKQVVKDYIDNPRLNPTKIGLIELGGVCEVTELVPIGGLSNRDKIKSAMNIVIPPPYDKGATPITDALQLAIDKLQKKGGTSQIILVSDGEPNCYDKNPKKPSELIEEARKKGINFELEMIGYGQNIQDKEFRSIASVDERSRYTQVNNDKELDKAFRTAISREPLPTINQGTLPGWVIPVGIGSTSIFIVIPLIWFVKRNSKKSNNDRKKTDTVISNTVIGGNLHNEGGNFSSPNSTINNINEENKIILLDRLKDTILSSNLSEAKKNLASEQIQVIKDIGDNKNKTDRDYTDKALNILRGIVSILPKATTLVEEVNKIAKILRIE